MKLTLEATDPTQDFIIHLYENKVRIVDAIESPNGWLDLTLEGSEINLLRVYAKCWCEPAVWTNIKDFDLLIGKDNGNGDE